MFILLFDFKFLYMHSFVLVFTLHYIKHAKIQSAQDNYYERLYHAQL